MADSDQEKTEEPTPERRKKARDEGQFPRAKDAGNTAGSLAVMLALLGFADTLRESMANFAWRCFHEPYSLVRGDPAMLAQMLGAVIVLVVVPFAVAAALGALASGLAESGYHPKLELAAPKWNRLDPLSKLKQMFSPQQALVNISLQLGRVVAVTLVSFAIIKDCFPTLLRLSRAGFSGAVVETAKALLQLAVWATAALVVLVVIDYIYNRYKHEKQIMMSHQEVKEELKQQEGDPRTKSRQRARAREIVRKGVAQAVKESDFVIANPTHVSVAIRYRPEEGAPVVMTKGYDEIALHIRKLAKENEIPVVENIQLARALAKRVKPGRQIPVELYAAVAEVLAFVYRLQQRHISA